MKIKELFEYVDEIMENVFSDKVKLRWINQIEAELQTDVLLLSADGVVQYTLDDMDAELLALPPYDEIYTEYLQYRICLAQEEPERANNKAATYNRIYTAYQRHVAQTANPGNGMAEQMQYYLTAYQIARKHGFSGTEEDWIHSLAGTKLKATFDEETGTLIVTAVGNDGGTTGGGTAEGGAEITIDSTLKTEGAAADAKAVGDAIDNLRSEMKTALGSYITDLAALVGGDA